ncbi:MAG: ABC transporter substrate-binding protein [Patescibacteria group bacterium]
MSLPDFWADIFKKPWRRLGRIIAKHEKVLLAILAVVILISGGFWYRQFSQKDASQPTIGGTYVEGIVFDSDKKELNQITMRLTKAGLLGFSAEGNLEPQLAEKWSTNDTKTEFRLTLEANIDRGEIVDALQQRSDLLGNVDVKADAERDIILTVTEASPSLPLLLTRPMFDYGPYKLGKANDQTTVFSRNTRKGALAAYINKIIIHTYPNNDELKDALVRNRIDGAVLPSSNETIKKYQRIEIGLNRYYAVMFNINKVPFRDVGLRQSLINSTGASAQPFSLTAPDQEPYKSLSQELVTKWQALGAKVELDLRPLEEVTGSIGPTRNFQALLIGIDYGAELDPYYIWHSTQVRATGNNVTGVREEAVDKLVDQIRSTLDVSDREDLIVQLHQLLATKGVALILQGEKVEYYLSNKIHFVAPTLPKSSADRFLLAAQWSVK